VEKRAFCGHAKHTTIKPNQTPAAMKIIIQTDALIIAALSIAHRRGDDLIDVRRTVSNETCGLLPEEFIPTP
jgi:hypothetical protein